MRKEAFFNLSRMLLLFIILASAIIPFINLPQSLHPVLPITIEPIFQNKTFSEKLVQTNEIPVTINSSQPVLSTSQPIVLSTGAILLFIYLTGVFISLLLFVYSIFSVWRLFRTSRKTTLEGIQVMIHSTDVPAFSFRKCILISRNDYDTNAEAILTHELSHIRQGHFYDLILMEIVKIIYWFNPLIYRMGRDLKDIHEFQADENTINSGVDSTKYQLLIIQKCVGHQSFALANSFNHCQIKKRITMMNKSKTSKAWCWKVATFLPLLALLLMAFSNRSEIVIPDSSFPVSVVALSEPVQQQYEQFKQKIEIKKDGNYIDNKLCSFQEIAEKGKEWYKKRYPDNIWIFLLIDELIPLSRVDEVRGALTHNYWVVQTTAGSDDLVYFMGDVSQSAKFTQGKFYDWISNQFNNYPEIKSKALKYKITYSFIIGKNGKVRDGHIINGTDSPEIDAAYEKILTQIPDWEPAKRGGESVSVYYHIMSGGSVVIKEK
jgi:beta-lactamase regulating signal transducer with metallopeptidase domain